jgi:hypothetical protein
MRTNIWPAAVRLMVVSACLLSNTSTASETKAVVRNEVSGNFRLNLTNYKVDVQPESGHVYIYDLNDALLFRLGGYEQFCFDCSGDVFDKDSLPHTLQQTTSGDITTLTFNVFNSAIDLTQIYEFDDSSSDFDYTFYCTLTKDMKMRDQLFLMDYNEAYINDMNEGIGGWVLQDAYSVGSISVNTDPNYSRSGNSLHIMMNNVPNRWIKVKSPPLGNMAENEILSFWVFPTENIKQITVMLASSTSDTDYRYKGFALRPLMWNKIEWNYRKVGIDDGHFNVNDVAKVIFYIGSTYFSSGTGHWYIDNIKFTKDNFQNIQAFDAYNHNFMDLSSGGRASYYAPRLLKTGFKNSDVRLLVSSRCSEHGEVEQIDSGKSESKTMPHFYTFSMDNHRFKATHDDEGNYIGGAVLLDYDLAKQGYSYGGKLNFNLNPPLVEIFAAKFPRNYKAAYTFTDDTDSSTEDTTKGTYYGTSDESDPNFGKKGFLGHDIKILATAFNYGDYANSWTDGSLKWLRDLAAFGFEIGPHDFANVDMGIDRPLLDLLLTEFIDNFAVYTTVRHSKLIYSFCGLGRIETDPNYYWLDLFENAPDTKYVWSGGLHFGNRNAYGDPWELPHHDGRLDYTGNPKWLYIYGRESSEWGWIYYGAGWGVQWNPERIDELIRQKGFAHIYIHARHRTEGKGMSYYTGIGYVINEDADELLGYLEQKMNNGDLWIEPPHIIFDYMLDKEKIDVERDDTDANCVRVTNYNNKAISGFTLEVHDSNICSAKTGDAYQIFVKDNQVTLAKLSPSECVCVQIIPGDCYDVTLPRLLQVGPNVEVDSAIFGGNDIIIDLSATGRGYQENRNISVDTGSVFSQYRVYVDGVLFDHNVTSKIYTLTMGVTGEHEIVITDRYLCRAADLDGVSPVNFSDFSILASNWLQTGPGLDGDIKEDGGVDFEDLMILAECWLRQ